MSTTSITRRSKLQRDKTISSFGEVSEEEQSGPLLSPGSSIPEDLIVYRHSYGYSCKKPSNLHLLGTETLVFLSGNLIHFFNSRTLELRIRRSVLGTGIGCITRNANPAFQDLLTIGENGIDPPIFIYKYPAMELQQQLVGGAKRNHSRVTYSEDGLLLASHSGEPDFVVTIWRWQEAQIVLKLHSFSKDVYNLRFSSNPEMFTSSGAGHIKFWKICRTFTGLKCEGLVGRFGQTEISDIYGLYQLEDGKVLSGSDWGNILVWENNAIKYEVFRKNHKTCHAAPITQIIWQDQEVLTISLDGYVRLWFWQTVESSIPADGENFVEVEPIFEVKIGGDECCQLMSMVKDPTPDSEWWYIQDGNGGIWRSTISSSGAGGESSAQQLYKCHAGTIVGVATSPCSPFVATLGEDGRLHVYNYASKELAFHKLFRAKGSAIIWASLQMAGAGNSLIVGFGSGVIRVLVVEFGEGGAVNGLTLMQKIKSHTRSITQLSLNGTEEILVSGSEDHSIFVHGVKKGENAVELVSIGRIELTSIVTAISWSVAEEATVLVGCRFGEIYEMELPREEQEYTTLSYELKGVRTRTVRFTSKKSEAKRLVKVKDLWYRKTFKKNDEAADQEEGDDGEEEEEDRHFVPAIPNKILWLMSVAKDVLWVAVAQFDAGYIYEYRLGEEQEACQRLIPVPGCYDLEINSVCQVDTKYLIFGLSNGMIRVTKINENDPYNLNDYWQLGMHDNNDGIVTAIAFSYDCDQLFTSGGDGNLFQYQWRGWKRDRVGRPPAAYTPVVGVRDEPSDDQNMLSSEEEKRKKNDDERHTVCDAEKRKVLAVLEEYKQRFRVIWEQNQSLPESQRLDDRVFELDPRITKDLNATLERKRKMAQREMEFDVERTQIGVRKLKSYFIEPLDSFPVQVLGIRSKDKVRSLCFRKLGPDFYEAKADLQRRMREFKEESKDRRQSMSVEFSKQPKLPALSTTTAAIEEEFRVHRIESVLRDMSEGGSRVSNLHTKLGRLLKKYKERKAYEQERKFEWEMVNQQRPSEGINHPDDVQAIEEAEASIGDYKLKLDADYVPPEREESGVDSLLGKWQELLSVQERIATMKRDYNDEVFSMRQKKGKLLSEIKRDVQVLQDLKLPEALRKEMVEFNDFDEDLEFPEKFIGEDCRRVEDEIPAKVEMSVLDHLSLIGSADMTPVEAELKEMRIQQRAFEQDLLLRNAQERIDGFDAELERLSHRRLSVEMDTLFLETYLLTLQKEYTVISGYHAVEVKLALAVDAKRIENGQFLSKILTQESALEVAKKNVELFRSERRALQQTFDSNCLDNKFTEFLQWIYEKDEEEVRDEGRTSIRQQSMLSSNSSSGNSREGDEECSITSSNYDETFCPRGCDPDLYKLVFDLRHSRFELNRKIAEEEQVHERVKGDLEFLTTEIRAIQVEQRRREEDYISLRREKQEKLNAIDTLIVLRLDQLQYFKDERGFEEDISKTLLVKRATLMQLYARVGELSAETLVINRSHRVNIVLLSRLKSDCHYMEQQIQALRDQIKGTMVKKFGMAVDLDELQEALLTKLLFEIRLHVDEVEEHEFRARMARLRRKVAEKQTQLTRVIQEGTEKLNVLTVLQEEKNNWDEVLAMQGKLRKKQTQDCTSFSKDLSGLKAIVKKQDTQIEFLQREIRTLSLKCKPFSSVPPLPAISGREGGEGGRGPTAAGRDNKKGSSSVGYFEYEGSAYASVINSDLSSGDRPQWTTVELRVEMERVVGKFLRKYLQNRLAEKQIERISGHIAEYFLQVLGTYCEMRRDELLPCIVEDVLKCLPRDAALMVKASSVSNLLDRMLRLYKARNDVERKEIVWGIVENACEVVGAKRGAAAAAAKTHDFFVEIWRQFFITLPLDEIKQDVFMEEVRRCLERVEGEIQLDSHVDKVALMQEVETFAVEHATEEISRADCESVLHAFFDCLVRL